LKKKSGFTTALADIYPDCSILFKGLTTEEANRRLLKDGPNELTPPKQDSELAKFLHHMFTGFSILLWIGTVLCFIAYALQYLTVRPEEIVHDNVNKKALYN
jgi:magnesium-transporting ATPase (P-type)